MPIVVSGKYMEKLLAIPKLPGTGTGSLMGNAVVDILRQWTGVPEWLAGLCFDTTSSNTGIHNGAITVIQKAFDKRLLFLACRHHILEIVATAAFDIFFVSSGPTIPIFGRFKEHWPLINASDYSPICKDTAGFALRDDEKRWLRHNSECVAQFVTEQLITKQPRDDYSEFLQLTLVALGEQQRIPGGVHFSPPGGYHRARWMAKGLYCLKMLCFREQFKMNAHELQAIKRICIFTVTLYVKAWFTAPMACDAPYNDLCLLQHIELFYAVDSQIAEVALKKITHHMWYLSEDLTPLSLFSDKVSANEKRMIVAALSTPAFEVDLRRADPKSINCFRERTLSQFVTKRSMNLFMALKLDQSFVSSDPNVWEARADFQIAKETVAALRVVNDCAERAVKLATDYNMALTQDEEQRQLIFQVVEYHRKQIMKPSKRKFKEV